jgi:hypothetical protein
LNSVIMLLLMMMIMAALTRCEPSGGCPFGPDRER